MSNRPSLGQLGGRVDTLGRDVYELLAPQVAELVKAARSTNYRLELLEAEREQTELRLDQLEARLDALGAAMVKLAEGLASLDA